MFTDKDNVSLADGGIWLIQLQATYNHLSLAAYNHFSL